MMNKETIIILIFHNNNSYKDTIECIESLYEIIECDFDIIVINNGLAGKYQSILMSKFPDVKYLFSENNSGFAGANNLGIDYGLNNDYKYFLILNSDTIVAKDFLTLLINKLNSDEKIGMVGPKTFYYDNRDKIWAMGGYIIKWRAIVAGINEVGREHSEYFNFRSFLGNQTKNINFDEVDYLPASCILVKREVIHKIGKLPDAYFFAYEEAEFALKAKKAGYKIVVEPLSVIWHKVGLSQVWSPELIYNSYRSRFMFLKRNYCFPINLMLIMNLAFIKYLQPTSNKKILLRAFLDNLKYKKITYDHLRMVRK